MKKISRREFMKYASGVAGGLVAMQSPLAIAQMSGGGGGGGMGGGAGVIDPPPGAAFADPVIMPSAITTENGRRVVTVNLTAERSAVDVNGVTANLLTYNGHLPGPTIIARKNDILRINFTNSLPMLGTNILGHDRSVTNLHTHGLHVSPMRPADDVMLMFMPGESFGYEYDLSLHPAATLNLYHPHIHGTVAEQLWNGMAGGLLIEDDTDALSGYEMHAIVIKDITLSGTEPEPYTSVTEYMHGKEGNTVMVNGQVNPVLSIRPGQVQRWRILNGSNARFYKLALEGHVLQVIGTEGGLLDKPYPLSSVLMSPGERLDVLVKASETKKNYRLLALPYARQGNMSSPQITLMTLACKGPSAPDGIPAVVNPDADRAAPSVKKTERIVLSMGRGKGYINGIPFTDMEHAYVVHSEVGTWEVWEIVNQSGMDHPFHQHVNHCQVLSITGGDSGYAAFYTKAPAWKDVVIIPKWGSAKILLPVMDYEGMTMFHCHIPEHEDIGMMGVWDIMG